VLPVGGATQRLSRLIGMAKARETIPSAAGSDRLLTTTRAVRKRLDLTRPVDRDVVMDCLRLAVQAPTGSNRQRWRWVLVDDPLLRQQLAELYRKSFGELQPDHDRGTAARITDSGQQTLDSAVHLAHNLHDVPLHVIPCTLDPLPPCPSLVEGAVFYGSILPAVWSFMLALRARALGSAWTTIHLYREREMAELLGIPHPEQRQAGLFPIAYTVGTDFKPADRARSEQRILWNGWSSG